jgi:hypothetical protein
MRKQDLSPGYTEKLKSEIKALGADLVGVADVEPLDLEPHFSFYGHHERRLNKHGRNIQSL